MLSEGAKESGTFLSTLQAEVNAKGLRECVHHLKVTKHELWQKSTWLGATSLMMALSTEPFFLTFMT